MNLCVFQPPLDDCSRPHSPSSSQPPPHSRAGRWSADRSDVRTGEGGEAKQPNSWQTAGRESLESFLENMGGGGGPLISAGAVVPTWNFKMERGGRADEKPGCWTGRRGGPDGR